MIWIGRKNTIIPVEPNIKLQFLLSFTHSSIPHYSHCSTDKFSVKHDLRNSNSPAIKERSVETSGTDIESSLVSK